MDHVADFRESADGGVIVGVDGGFPAVNIDRKAPPLELIKHREADSGALPRVGDDDGDLS